MTIPIPSDFHKVDFGQLRGDQDEGRRYLPIGISFDTRPMVLATEIEEDWEPSLKEQWLENKRNIRQGVIYEHGIKDYDQKIENFRALGPAPWSVVGRHSEYLRQIRDSFTSGYYYSALLGACGLGERVPNHLVLGMRDDYPDHPATRQVAGKSSFDDWKICIRTLKSWGVFSAHLAKDYTDLMRRRHGAIHYRPSLDDGDARADALEAIELLKKCIEALFRPHGTSTMFISDTPGFTFVARAAEDDPLFRQFFLPASVLVSPAFRMEPGGGFFEVYDRAGSVPALTDEEFVASLGREL